MILLPRVALAHGWSLCRNIRRMPAWDTFPKFSMAMRRIDLSAALHKPGASPKYFGLQWRMFAVFGLSDQMSYSTASQSNQPKPSEGNPAIPGNDEISPRRKPATHLDGWIPI